MILRDGYGNPAAAAATIEGAPARAPLDGDTFPMFMLPTLKGDTANPSTATTTQRLVCACTPELRASAHRTDDATPVHRLARDASGQERASAWSAAEADITLALDRLAAADGISRRLMLDGAAAPLGPCADH